MRRQLRRRVRFPTAPQTDSRSENNPDLLSATTGGTILGVAVDVSDEAYLDMEQEAARAVSID